MAPDKITRGPRDFLGIIRELRLAWRLFRDRQVSAWVKSVPLLTLAYLIWPLDILSDFYLGLGQLDDLAVIVLGLRLFVALCPEKLVQEHRLRLSGSISDELDDTVDTTYRVFDDAPNDGPLTRS